MLLYTGWLGTHSKSLNGNLWLTGAVTQGAFVTSVLVDIAISQWVSLQDSTVS